MPITDLIPWKKEDPDRAEEARALQRPEDPLLTFEQEMNRLFDDFFQDTGLAPSSALNEGWDLFSPRVDVVETDKEIKVIVELPGLEREEIDVGLSQNVLTISGEKRQEKEEKGHSYLRAERSYGSFKRSIPLPCQVDAGKTDALFRKGVLTITLPKLVKEKARRRITIKA
jgi:HSP20 family protein